MAYIVIAYIVRAFIVMAFIVVAYIVMTCIVYGGPYRYDLYSYGLYTYGLYSHCLHTNGLYSYCPYSHGPYTKTRCPPQARSKLEAEASEIAGSVEREPERPKFKASPTDTALVRQILKQVSTSSRTTPTIRGTPTANAEG